MTPPVPDGPDIELAGIVRQLATLEVPCAFWACPGPDVAPVSMVTCRTCWLIWDARQALARPAVARTAAGEDDAEVWIPPADDCMNHQHEPCPHCSSRVFHHRTGRCGSCGRRPAAAGARTGATRGE